MLEYLPIKLKEQLEARVKEYIKFKKLDFIDDETIIGIAIIAFNKKYPNDQELGMIIRNLVNSYNKRKII